MVRKRDLMRRVPLLSGVARRLDALEAENRRLRRHLWEATVADVSALSEPGGGGAGGGLPVPPAVLRDLVTGTDDVAWFLQSGREGMLTVVEALRRNGVDLARVERLLDFGCGCGRVIRHFDATFAGKLHGIDRNPLAVEWCRRHLPGARFEVSASEPPLACPERSFDAAYAFSVFTHLTLEMQATWMEEIWRVLKPRALLVVSLHGDSYQRELPPKERSRYRRGDAVVLQAASEGSNVCNAYHPEAFVRRTFASWFAVAEFVPTGARGNPPQDL